MTVIGARHEELVGPRRSWRHLRHEELGTAIDHTRSWQRTRKARRGSTTSTHMKVPPPGKAARAQHRSRRGTGSGVRGRQQAHTGTTGTRADGISRAGEAGGAGRPAAMVAQGRGCGGGRPERSSGGGHGGVSRHPGRGGRRGEGQRARAGAGRRPRRRSGAGRGSAGDAWVKGDGRCSASTPELYKEAM